MIIQLLLALNLAAFIGLYYSNIDAKKRKTLHFILLTTLTILVVANIRASYSLLQLSPVESSNTYITLQEHQSTFYTIVPVDGYAIFLNVTVTASKNATSTVSTVTTITISDNTYYVVSSNKTFSGIASTNRLLMITYNNGYLNWFSITNYSVQQSPFRIAFTNAYLIQKPDGYEYVLTEVYMVYFNYTTR